MTVQVAITKLKLNWPFNNFVKRWNILIDNNIYLFKDLRYTNKTNVKYISVWKLYVKQKHIRMNLALFAYRTAAWGLFFIASVKKLIACSKFPKTITIYTDQHLWIWHHSIPK